MSAAGAKSSIPRPNIPPTPPRLNSNTVLLIDYHSNKVLAEKNIDLKVEPASLTKMMTMYVVDHEIRNHKLKLGDMVTVSKNAWKTPGSRMFLEVGTQVSVEDLIKGIIIQSGNDASVAIAEHIAGSERAFADLMNAYAEILGMKDSHFVNATGLPAENHVTTARDMAILAKALIQEFPESYEIYSHKKFNYHNIEQINRNRLLWRNAMVDGIKTGHTDSAGYCLVASGRNEDGMRLVAVVLGAKDDNMRIQEANKLLKWGFRFYETHRIYQAGKALQQVRVWMGEQQQLDLGLKEDLFITINQGQYEDLKATMSVPKVVKAPAAEGDTVGHYQVELNGEVIVERPLVALKTINKGSLLTRVFDSISLTIHSLIDKIRF